MILDTAGVGIAFIRQRQIIRCNQRYAEIYGYANATEMLGNTTASLYPNDAASRALGEAAYPTMARGQSYKSEVRMKRRDQTGFWAHLTGKLVNPGDTGDLTAATSTGRTKSVCPYALEYAISEVDP